MSDVVMVTGWYTMQITVPILNIDHSLRISIPKIRFMRRAIVNLHKEVGEVAVKAINTSDIVQAK